VNGLLLLIPVALALGLGGLAAFLWALKAGQFDDPEGAAGRILFDDDLEGPPAPPRYPVKERNAP
jgi:cbb3-type cytochrome oxidase maturation protein